MEKKLIEAIKSADNEVIEKLYMLYKDPFMGYGSRYQLEDFELLEIYHDALMEIRKHAFKGNLETVFAGFKTYLFSIGKFKIYKYLKERGKSPLQILNEIPDEESIAIEMFEENSLDENQQKLKFAFKNLGKKCQKMLINFYYKELSIKEIMIQENYESENTVRSQKSRCLKTLKMFFNK